METKGHQLTLELLEAPPAEVEAGGRFVVRVGASCPDGCDLGGARVEITDPDGVSDTSRLAGSEGGEGGDAAAVAVELRAPPRAGAATWVIALREHDVQGVVHTDASLTVSTVVVPHDTSIAVWGVPSPIKGAAFAVRVGIKCSALCRLGGQLVEVLDEAGAKVGAGRLEDAPRPGTAALYEGEVSLTAPGVAGVHARSVRFAAAGLGLPHRDASGHFTFRSLEPPQHTVTVRVVPKGFDAPVKNVEVRLGAYHAATDADGLARVRVPTGTYELYAWRIDIEPVSQELVVRGDADVEVDIGPRVVVDEDAKRYG